MHLRIIFHIVKIYLIMNSFHICILYSLVMMSTFFMVTYLTCNFVQKSLLKKLCARQIINVISDVMHLHRFSDAVPGYCYPKYESNYYMF